VKVSDLVTRFPPYRQSELSYNAWRENSHVRTAKVSLSGRGLAEEMNLGLFSGSDVAFSW